SSCSTTVATARSSTSRRGSTAGRERRSSRTPTSPRSPAPSGPRASGSSRSTPSAGCSRAPSPRRDRRSSSSRWRSSRPGSCEPAGDGPASKGGMNDALALLLRYGYLVVFGVVLLENLGLPVPGVAVLIVAGGLAGGGHLRLATVGLLGVVAALLGDLVWYGLGRWPAVPPRRPPPAGPGWGPGSAGGCRRWGAATGPGGAR